LKFLRFDSSGTYQSIAMQIDSASGNVGIGTSSPAGKLQVVSANNTDTTVIGSFDANNQTQRIVIGFQSIAQHSSADPIRFLTGGLGGTERMRIGSNGVFTNSTTGSYTGSGAFGGVNMTAQPYSSFIANHDDRALVIMNGNAGATAGAITTQVATGAGYHLQSYTNTTIVFNVASDGNVLNTNNSYGALSDIKLKENIVDATPKLKDLCKVKVRQYTLKNDENKLKQIGVVAQELEEVFAGLVEETFDKDMKGNNLGTTTKSVKYSVFVPMLIKAMQEQQALIENLTTRLNALEGK
jgi:hypothetical protein